ncbi:MAG: DUF4160 domain-containing protein [Anaerolineales bacterium]|nr:DUF4160 domain-containing protein [Anaerolineales bacterium]
MLKGQFPRKATNLVKEWIDLNRDALLEDWQLAQAEQDLQQIEPLE